MRDTNGHRNTWWGWNNAATFGVRQVGLFLKKKKEPGLQHWPSSLLSSFYWWEQLVGTVTGLLLIFEPDNLERDLELSTAFSRESFVYLTLTELFPVASLANSSLISLERLHATLFPLDIVLWGSGTTSSLFCVYSWLFSLTLSSVIALLYLRTCKSICQCISHFSHPCRCHSFICHNYLNCKKQSSL